MISAVPRSISIFKPVQRVVEPALIQVELAAAAEKSNQITRDAANAKAVEEARQKFLQTQYIGPARATARSVALGMSRPQSLQTQYVGPLRAEARLTALKSQHSGAADRQAYYRDLRTGCHVGPKPASIIAAEDRYRQMLDVVV